MKNRQITVAVSGSFHRHYDAIKLVIKSFEELDIKVLSPRDSQIINPDEEVAILATDDIQNPEVLERRHLDAIQKADALYVCNPEGYLGGSTVLELGWANALGKPIFTSNKVADASLKFFTGSVAIPKQVKEILTQRSPIEAIHSRASIVSLQEYIHEMVIRRGFEKETAQDVLVFLMEEIGELAKAMRKYLGRKTDQKKADHYGNVREELADILIILFDLANILEVPLSEALYEKEQANEKRTWS